MGIKFSEKGGKKDTAPAPPQNEAQTTDHDIYAHLPDHEASVLKRQVATPAVKVGWRMLYRYATLNDMLIIVVSSICAMAAGAAMPLMNVVFGQLAGDFQNYLVLQTTTKAEFKDTVTSMVLYFVYLGIGEFVATYVSTVGFIYTGEHISGKIREHYLAACLRQNIGYFDNLGAGEITTRIVADTNLVQDGISEKIGLGLNAVATFVTAYVIGFVYAWKYALILSSSVVALTAESMIGAMFIVRFTKLSLASYTTGATVVEEALSSVRNAIAFGTQDKLAREYDKYLVVGEKWGLKSKIALAMTIGFMYNIIYLTYGLGFWMGGRFLVDGEITLSSILAILMSILIGAFAMGNLSPNVQAFTTAIAAAGKIFDTIDRVSPIDPDSKEGIQPDTVEGTLELRHVKHIYPSRPEVVVIEDISLVIPAGKQTAFVGASGSGKSTVIGLVERFYDPVGGTVLLDGHDLSTLNLRWLRQQIALVSQEPTLFSTTIFENIRYGLMGTRFESEDMETQKSLIHKAAQTANAHEFISALPLGYETQVGERGLLLSGGQKQRIAIARAVVSDPKILLLDEATSALDTKSEGVVQAALDNAAAGRTTIVIAHRLSTIKNADNIVVMQHGRILEQGTHNELLKRGEVYHDLVEAQKITATTETLYEDDESLALDTSDSGSPSSPLKEHQSHGSINRTQTTKSASSMALAARTTKTPKKAPLWSLIKLLTSFNKKETHLMLIGLFFSLICGAALPVQSILFSKALTALSRPLDEAAQIRSDVNFWSLMFLMLAFVMLLSSCAQNIAFAFCSERLIHRVRDRTFRTFLRQDVEFFDKDENSTGALTSFLSTETTHMAGLSGVTLGTILSVATTLIVAMIVSIVMAWKLALICMSTIPILLACGYFRFHMLAKFQQQAKKAYEQSASYACEATSAIRTVASLGRERDVLEQYQLSLAQQAKKSLHSVLVSSLLYSASQSLIFLCVALGFWYGALRIAEREYTMFQFFVSFMTVIFGAQSAGSIFSSAPDMGKAKHAASEMKELFDREPKIDAWSSKGEHLAAVEGTIEFRDVHFRYPTRPQQPVLRGIDLMVQPGQYIALVGGSGSGKSTIISLLERFYDPLAGTILLDGKDISNQNLNEYRSFLALVSQEPMLYQGSVRENLLMGSDQHNNVTDAQIEYACREANIYDFIISLPDGFETVVGNKGSMLSGGQKQRLAIARALLRNPKVLLLDEATSALDSDSEHVVQAALDKAAKGRTTIAVAHRLSTIQNADIIYVLDQGRIVERGDHAELMRLGGKYSELVKLQNLGNN